MNLQERIDEIREYENQLEMIIDHLEKNIEELKISNLKKKIFLQELLDEEN